MAAGDVKQLYAATTALAVTVLNTTAITSSTTHLLGWESAAIDNSSLGYTDFKITGKFMTETASVVAGEIRMHVVAEMNDSTWPDVFDGTESVETVTDTEVRDAICHLVAMTVTDTTTARTYHLSCPSLLRALGNVPRKFVIFITQSTGTTLETTGTPNAVYVQGIYYQVAQS